MKTCNHLKKKFKYTVFPVWKQTKTPGRGYLPGVNRTVLNYRYLAVLTLTPGPMVEATVQERIY